MLKTYQYKKYTYYAKNLFPCILLSSSVFLGACTTIDPYTRGEKTSNTVKGAGIGALSGAVLGVLVGDNRKSVLIGAGIGALAGGGIGYYMDTQEAKLRHELEATGVSVTRYGDSIILNMPGNITFDTDSSAISAGFYGILDSVTKVVNEY